MDDLIERKEAIEAIQKYGKDAISAGRRKLDQVDDIVELCHMLDALPAVDGLQAMDEEAAIAEGFADYPAGTDSPLTRFSEFWDKTIKREDLREFGWHADPWVWVIEFERCEKPEGWDKK